MYVYTYVRTCGSVWLALRLVGVVRSMPCSMPRSMPVDVGSSPPKRSKLPRSVARAWWARGGGADLLRLAGGTCHVRVSCPPPSSRCIQSRRQLCSGSTTWPWASSPPCTTMMCAPMRACMYVRACVCACLAYVHAACACTQHARAHVGVSVCACLAYMQHARARVGVSRARRLCRVSAGYRVQGTGYRGTH